jgi:hypothetical protein
MNLCSLRKKASENLVRAMDEDDNELFSELEQQVRHFNRQTHRVKQSFEKQKQMQKANDLYLKRSAAKYVAVDDLPLGNVSSSRKRSHKENR